tara:strand:- start:1450 stop:3609 length:2160 start_codon:yes stop_codon:yes gene_type:complete
MKRKNILVLPGDGIGVEVCQAAIPILKALNLPMDIKYAEIGWECWKKYGDTVPQKTWGMIKQADAVLLAAITSHGKEKAESSLPVELQGLNRQYVSPIIALRQKLELYANVRPSHGIGKNGKNFNICIIRENTEGLYAGLDFHKVPSEFQHIIKHKNIETYGYDETTWSVRLQTKLGLERIIRYAFKYAVEHNMSRVTLADKPNVLRESGNFARDIFYSVSREYPQIEADIHNVDAVAMWLHLKPEVFGVIVCENLFGDILSDLAAGLMGGLGLAPSANIGKDIAYFEPVHGSAPKLAGKNKANPIAMFKSISLMLAYLGFEHESKLVENAVDYVIKQNKFLTYDLGGQATTQDCAENLISALYKKQDNNTATVITIGNELLSGRVLNSNSQDLSLIAKEQGLNVIKHLSVPDCIQSISKEILYAAAKSDYVIISGGLGPTTDDKTREAITGITGCDLIFDEKIWSKIQHRLKSHGVAVDKSNRIQAFFPVNSDILYNHLGTAHGFKLCCENSTLITIPGPPKEAKAMLNDALTALSLRKNESTTHDYSLLGISEAEVNSIMTKHFSDPEITISYLWQYPYIHLTIDFEHGYTQVDSAINFVETKFEKYIVSKKGLYASNVLKSSISKYFIYSHDSDLSQVSSSWGFNHINNSQKKVLISLSHPLNTINDNLDEHKKLTLSCYSNFHNKSEDIQFPCRGKDFLHFIREYVAWFILKLER